MDALAMSIAVTVFLSCLPTLIVLQLILNTLEEHK